VLLTLRLTSVTGLSSLLGRTTLADKLFGTRSSSCFGAMDRKFGSVILPSVVHGLTRHRPVHLKTFGKAAKCSALVFFIIPRCWMTTTGTHFLYIISFAVKAQVDSFPMELTEQFPWTIPRRQPSRCMSIVLTPD